MQRSELFIVSKDSLPSATCMPRAKHPLCIVSEDYMSAISGRAGLCGSAGMRAGGVAHIQFFALNPKP